MQQLVRVLSSSGRCLFIVTLSFVQSSLHVLRHLSLGFLAPQLLRPLIHPHPHAGTA